MNIAHIALPVPLAKTFDYRIPNEMRTQIVPGVRVRVEFGKRKRSVGIVVSIDSHTEWDYAQLKPIETLLDREAIFPAALWKVLLWSSRYYHHPLGDVLFHALPVLLRQGKAAQVKTPLQWQLTSQGKNCDPASLKRAVKQQALLRLLQNQASHNSPENTSFDRQYYLKLAERGLVEEVPNAIPALSPDNEDLSASVILNQEQRIAIQMILSYLGQFQTCLLEGVTGSGKTEVYLSVIAAVLKEQQQALVLVPEISLTPQTLSRFKHRFTAPIEMLHSGLNNTDRLAVFLRARQGKTAIVIGTRSALFTPFKRLGCIVVDEEHDGSYKQQDGFRYHARDMAIVRAHQEGIPIVLGSATPSLESLHNAQMGKYRYLRLTRRAGNATFASQHIIDLKGLVLESGLSKPLLMRIREHLAKQQQVLLFLNRRGYAPVLICHECGWLATCKRCDKSYTYHQKQHKLSCHHCDSVKTVPGACAECGSVRLHTLGFGTEQVEIQLKKQFPDIPITRIDRDSTTQKGALESHLARLHQGHAHILIGTQILAKGHHFPHVTLVGILDVDSALFSSDFRATERLAQIYTQVAGRAGREHKRGEVILQTYHPEHPLLTLLLNQHYHAFANKALLERKATLLPPFSHQVLIRASDKNNIHAPAFLTRLYSWLKEHDSDPQLWLLKPIPAILPKKAGSYRWQLLLQHPDRTKLHQLAAHIQEHISQWPEAKHARWMMEIDPIEA